MTETPTKRIGRPPGADADRTRERILTAALDAFAARGYDGATIRQITGAAGVGHNLVRHYFGSKDDLWRATVHHALDPGAARIVELLQGGLHESSEQTMRAGIDVLLSELDANPAAMRLLMIEALHGGPRFDELFDEVLAPVGESFVAYFRHAGNELADVDARVLTLYVFGAVYGSLSLDGLRRRTGLARGDARADSLAPDLLELVVGGLLRRH